MSSRHFLILLLPMLPNGGTNLMLFSPLCWLLPSTCILPFVCLFYYMGVNFGVFPRATYCFSNVSTVKYCALFRAYLFGALLLQFWVC